MYVHDRRKMSYTTLNILHIDNIYLPTVSSVVVEHNVVVVAFK